jgi:AbrB family looped-hinge helix DNA binding protein
MLIAVSVTRVYKKGQVTIPKAVRDAAGIDDGDRVVVEARDQGIIVRRARGVLEFVPPASHRPDTLPWSRAREAARDDHLEHHES